MFNIVLPRTKHNESAVPIYQQFCVDATRLEGYMYFHIKDLLFNKLPTLHCFVFFAGKRGILESGERKPLASEVDIDLYSG